MLNYSISNLSLFFQSIEDTLSGNPKFCTSLHKLYICVCLGVCQRKKKSPCCLVTFGKDTYRNYCVFRAEEAIRHVQGSMLVQLRETKDLITVLASKQVGQALERNRNVCMPQWGSGRSLVGCSQFLEELRQGAGILDCHLEKITVAFMEKRPCEGKGQRVGWWKGDKLDRYYDNPRNKL